MKLASWRNATLVLALVCCVQRWQSCTRTHESRHDAASTQSQPSTGSTLDTRAMPSLPETLAGAVPELPAHSPKIFGIHPPAWVARLLPQPGETMRAYRERVLPLAQLAIAPQRARVARMRDELHLPAAQRAELDAAVGDAATAIENRIASAIINGELQPGTMRPMTGVTLARDMLDIVDRGNARFTSALTQDQRTQLAASRFDFADYLLFSTPWENALPH